MDVVVEEDEGPQMAPTDRKLSVDDRLLDEQAVRLYNLCDSDRKGFIVRSDLSKLEGLIGDATASRLEGFFEFLDQDRVNVVHQQQFVEAIKPLLINIEKGIATNNNDRKDIKRRRHIIGDENKINSADLESHIQLSLNSKNLTSANVIAPVTLQDELTVAAMGQKSDNYPYTVANSFNEKHSYLEREVRSKPVSPQDQQFAEVIKRASASHMDLPRGVYDVKDMRKQGWEPSLADELKAAEHIPAHASQADLRTPDRIFKVVFVGDSAVGKTCFLHRFCHNRFKPLFNATIGVDFTVKTIRLKDRLVAVQLWDTAGQERFRSITKQYFRKADGVVLMYDVTSEQSFLNVRNWIESVRTGVDEGCVMCLVGNKVDLFANSASRQLTYEHGRKLAEEFGIMFFETSAATGHGIDECMRAMAMRLQKREEDHLEEALKLEMSIQKTKRSWCCV